MANKKKVDFKLEQTPDEVYQERFVRACKRAYELSLNKNELFIVREDYIYNDFYVENTYKKLTEKKRKEIEQNLKLMEKL